MGFGELLDSFNDVDDGAARADAYVGGGRGEVVGDGAAGSVTFGGFNVHHFWRW